jgi:hypothetical protein
LSLFAPRLGVGLSAAALVISGCTDPVGPPQNVESIEVLPKSARIWTVGDSQRFTAHITPVAGEDTATITVKWVSRDPSLLAVTSAGVAKSLKKGGSTYVVATAGGKSDSALVEVPLTPCGAVKSALLTVGQVVNDIPVTGFCAADVPDAEYVVVAHGTSLVSNALTSLEVVGQGLGAPPVTSQPPAASRALFTRSTGLTFERHLRRDTRAEAAVREEEKVLLTPLVTAAQAWYGNRGRAALRSSAMRARDTVGDIDTVNVNMGASCLLTSRIDHIARVAAVSEKALILSDQGNPAGGFTDAEYARFATTFDTLVNPLDTLTFGAPTDLDGNGRIIILFTRAINELTPPGSPTYDAGRTMSRDLFPKTTDVDGHPGCAASNVGEIFYMLVPDPNGQVNGNTSFTKEFVAGETVVTIAHEYQHMINISRRMYVLKVPSCCWIDEVWLHEGLSHTAESLVFRQESGLGTRTNTDLAAILATDRAKNAFNDYMIGDFFLYDAYVDNAAATSPYRQADDLQTRGATWTFMRYAADRIGPTDNNLFFRLVNSSLTGLTNLETQLGLSATTFQAWVRDYSISIYADDLIPVASIYTQPSWNMRSIYAGIDIPNFYWPLDVQSLPDNTPIAATVIAGGSFYFTFSTLAGTEALIRATGSSGTSLPAGITLSIIRTK